ncbi:MULTISPECIES: hypothetical protein [Moorena]|uniref:hypothetical protein n=1 Tax=Moorena TaxID=1155738 RepID=UPI001054DC8D|nr:MULTISPECIES: hypothetical protein [Moorena]NEQ17844.1 hypothetical protein [Moorena sp. SIO3E2]NEP30519.1 hypothetical protein [Moorena sp. SIO3B2]NEQ11364.1 hypothetical protein [Moorena sp. SIO4E2]NER86786.1 hypothetical protein [Moorena sp. SIO3A2]NES40641.1 hypothetical protein [Moorena sp. SIO2C4]
MCASVTQGEDASRIPMHQLPQIFAVARNFALNIYRSHDFSNMAQAQRRCQFGLDTQRAHFQKCYSPGNKHCL